VSTLRCLQRIQQGNVLPATSTKLKLKMMWGKVKSEKVKPREKRIPQKTFEKIRPSTKHKDLFIKLHQNLQQDRKVVKFLFLGFPQMPIKFTKICTEITLRNCQKGWLLDSPRSTRLNYDTAYSERKRRQAITPT